jgi:hypothetical protein
MGAAHLFRGESGLYGCSPCSCGCSQALASYSSDGGLSFGPFMLIVCVILSLFFHIFYIFQLSKRILLVLMWLSGTDFTVLDLVVAAFARADHRMLGTAYSSGSCKLAAALPQKSVRTVFSAYCIKLLLLLVLLFVFYLFFMSFVGHYLS